MTAAPDSPFLTLLQLEKEARQAESPAALAYVMVNRARVLVAYRQAVMVRLDGAGRATVVAVSDVATPDPNAPFVRWLQRVATHVAGGDDGGRLHPVPSNALSDRDRDEAADWMAPHMLWCPLMGPGGQRLGALLLARDEAWSESDFVLLDHISEAWGHAWQALQPARRRSISFGVRRQIGLVGAVAVAAVMALPVSQSALAPAEVVARHPDMVGAPLDGVIETVAVAPNSAVALGDLLFRYEDSGLFGRLQVAEEELAVALTELRTARQGAFSDPRRNAEVAVLEARVALREAERDQISAQVARSEVRAERAGVVVFRDRADLEGRPVRTGERVMLVSDPHDTELRIELPVADGVVLTPGAPVRLFLDRAPLSPVDATLEYASYEAEAMASGVLSYRLTARFSDSQGPRIGLRGTAKVYGGEVPLFLYLFRRPIAVVRQWTGL